MLDGERGHMSDVLITYQWEIFISLKVLATISLIAFFVSRYVLTNDTLGRQLSAKARLKKELLSKGRPILKVCT